MLKQALSHLKNSPQAVFLYTGITVLYVALKVYGESLYMPDKQELELEDFPKHYLLISGLVTALFYATVQALIFPILGKEIDKPLWKIPQTIHSFIKFFSFWFAMHFLTLMLRLMIMQNDLLMDERANLFLMWLIFSTTIIPFGATIMFYGDTSIDGLKQTLSTIFGQFPYYLVTCLVTFFIYSTLYSFIFTGIPDTAIPLLELVGSLTDLIIFAYCWEICKKHRDELENMDDLDF